jgi:hypothetical protein
MSSLEKRNPDCLLGYYPEKELLCHPLDCCRCGWHPNVEAKRKQDLRKAEDEGRLLCRNTTL